MTDVHMHAVRGVHALEAAGFDDDAIERMLDALRGVGLTIVPSIRATVDADSASLRGRIVQEISDELDRAYAKHGSASWGRHEFYAILLEARLRRVQSREGTS